MPTDVSFSSCSLCVLRVLVVKNCLPQRHKGHKDFTKENGNYWRVGVYLSSWAKTANGAQRNDELLFENAIFGQRLTYISVSRS